MLKEKKKYYQVVESLTYKGKFYSAGDKILLTEDQKNSLIIKNLVK